MMISSYNEFAEVYDIFMEDVDYYSWSRYVRELLGRYGLDKGRVLDTACGTGNITIPLSQMGYEMWGLDLSGDMLSIAEGKARMAKQKIRFVNQDMVNMNLKEKFDAVLCMCDGVNYITDEQGLITYFTSVFNTLDKKGIFVFDVSSYYKIRYILGNNTFHEEKNNMHYIWNNNFDEESDTIDMDLIFFILQGSLYKKFEEYHVQKAHKGMRLKEILEDIGFSDVRSYGEYGFNEPEEAAERIFFTAIKG